MSAFGISIEASQVCVIAPGTKKRDALETLIDAVTANPCIQDKEAFARAVFDREAVMSTGIGGGIAIPHVRIPEVSSPTVGVAVAPAGLEFDTIDKKPVHILVLFATPKGADKEYLGMLAQVMAALRDKDLFNRLTACETPEEVFDVLSG